MVLRNLLRHSARGTILFQDLRQNGTVHSFLPDMEGERSTFIQIVPLDLTVKQRLPCFLLRMIPGQIDHVFPALCLELFQNLQEDLCIPAFCPFFRNTGHRLNLGIPCRNRLKCVRVFGHHMTEANVECCRQHQRKEQIPANDVLLPEEVLQLIAEYVQKHHSLSSFPVISRKTSFRVGSSVVTLPKTALFSSRTFRI